MTAWHLQVEAREYLHTFSNIEIVYHWYSNLSYTNIINKNPTLHRNGYKKLYSNANKFHQHTECRCIVDFSNKTNVVSINKLCIEQRMIGSIW